MKLPPKASSLTSKSLFKAQNAWRRKHWNAFFHFRSHQLWGHLSWSKQHLTSAVQGSQWRRWFMRWRRHASQKPSSSASFLSQYWESCVRESAPSVRIWWLLLILFGFYFSYSSKQLQIDFATIGPHVSKLKYTCIRCLAGLSLQNDLLIAVPVSKGIFSGWLIDGIRTALTRFIFCPTVSAMSRFFSAEGLPSLPGIYLLHSFLFSLIFSHSDP